MIRYKYHFILIKYVIRHLPDDRQSHRTCDVIRHDYVKLRLDQLARLDRIKSGMGRQDLLRHCHSHVKSLLKL